MSDSDSDEFFDAEELVTTVVQAPSVQPVQNPVVVQPEVRQPEVSPVEQPEVQPAQPESQLESPQESTHSLEKVSEPSVEELANYEEAQSPVKDAEVPSENETLEKVSETIPEKLPDKAPENKLAPVLPLPLENSQAVASATEEKEKIVQHHDPSDIKFKVIVVPDATGGTYDREEVDDLAKFQVRNVDTGEVCHIEEVPNYFAQSTRLANLASQSLARSNIKDRVAAEEAPVVEGKELEQTRVALGFGIIARALGKSSDSMNRSGAPNAVSVKTNKKKIKSLDGLKLVQVITPSQQGAIWAVAISLDGRFVATGGQDAVITVWKVHGAALTVEETQETSPGRPTSDRLERPDSKDEKALPEELCNPVLDRQPFRLFTHHAADIIDLAWSKSGFLLSGSIDKTVRLWHVSRRRCLMCFQHADFVTSVAFHPTDESRFLSGSFDMKLRQWNIPEHRVMNWETTDSIITAVAYSPDGKLAVAGQYHGECAFFQQDNLRYKTQVDCRNRHGAKKGGKKVTGLEFSTDGKQLLVTTNDSRIRLFDVGGFGLKKKFKGLQNDTLQIRAHFSPDCSQIICGSQTAHAFIWDLTDEKKRSGFFSPSRTNNKTESYEYFKAEKTRCLDASFLPPNMVALARPNDPTSRLIMTAGYDGSIKFFEKSLT
jgi:WD40 repeat protein